MKKRVEIYRYRPQRIGDSERYWCFLCRNDFDKTHRHFEFMKQVKL